MKYSRYYSKKYGKIDKITNFSWDLIWKKKSQIVQKQNKIEKGEPEMGHNKNYPTKRSKNDIDSSILNDYAN